MDTFLLFLLVGVVAQAVDGALGMAYGVISSSVLRPGRSPRQSSKRSPAISASLSV